ncbi:MAG: hypothetical protein ABI760_24805, partial [Ferruginibacter sp.]
EISLGTVNLNGGQKNGVQQKSLPQCSMQIYALAILFHIENEILNIRIFELSVAAIYLPYIPRYCHISSKGLSIFTNFSLPLASISYYLPGTLLNERLK